MGVQPGDPIPGGSAQVHPVEAKVALEWDVLVGVGLGVPCVAALLGLTELLPQVTDRAGKSNCGHLKWNQNFGTWDLLLFMEEMTGKQSLINHFLTPVKALQC